MDEQQRTPDIELAVVASDLAGKVETLTGAIKDLRQAYAQLSARTGTVERRTSRSVIVAVVVVLALVGAGLLGYTQVVTSDRLDVAVQDQRRVTQEVLCPLFALVLGGYDPESRPAGEARDRYVEAFGEFTRIFGRLQCTTGLVPPREGG